MKRLKCHKGVGPKVTGEALVADDNFSARYDLDRIQGVFSRPQHKLAGQSYDQKILVFNTAKGGVATAWMLHEMTARGITPKGILFNEANTTTSGGSPWLAKLLRKDARSASVICVMGRLVLPTAARFGASGVMPIM